MEKQKESVSPSPSLFSLPKCLQHHLEKHSGRFQLSAVRSALVLSSFGRSGSTRATGLVLVIWKEARTSNFCLSSRGLED